MTTRSVRSAAVLLCAGLTAAGALAGCSSSKTPASPSASTSAGPAALLQQAKSTVDNAQTMHIKLTASGSSGQFRGLDGSLERPDQFQGTVTISLAGASVDVPVVSTGGQTYAKLPLTSSYTTVNPATYGVKDPGQLLNPSTGLSSLLPQTQDLKSEGQKRINGEVVDEITGQLPAKTLAGVLPITQQSGTVPVTYDVADSNKQLRRAAVSGNLNGQGSTTYTLDLDHYGDPVTINAPS